MTSGVKEPEELEEEEVVEQEETIEENDDNRPAFLKEEEPSGKLDRAKYWLLKGKTKEELVAAGHNEGTVRIASNSLVKEGHMKKPQRPTRDKPGTAVSAQAPARGLQIFAKGSPPEAIIEGISIPMVDGQAQGFEQGMKFGMSTIVLAVRLMQELSAVSLQQVKPLIDMVRSVREGEAAAFKGGADEGAMKAAQAMGGTIMPMMSDMQAAIAGVGKGSEANPVQAMMVRTMEPLIKNMMSKMMPGMEQDRTPGDWTRRSE